MPIHPPHSILGRDVPRQDKACKLCNTNKVEDKILVSLLCTKYDHIKNFKNLQCLESKNLYFFPPSWPNNLEMFLEMLLNIGGNSLLRPFSPTKMTRRFVLKRPEVFSVDIYVYYLDLDVSLVDINEIISSLEMSWYL